MQHNELLAQSGTGWSPTQSLVCLYSIHALPLMKQGRSLLDSSSHHWILSSYKCQSTSFCPDNSLSSCKWCLAAEEWHWNLNEFLLCSLRSKCPPNDTIPVFVTQAVFSKNNKWGTSNCSLTSRLDRLTAMCWIFGSDWLFEESQCFCH